MNTDDPPAPVLYDLHLNETSGPVRINFTTVDSSDPMDNYTKWVFTAYNLYGAHYPPYSASLILLAASADIESLSYSGTPPPHINVNSSSPYSIVCY